MKFTGVFKEIVDIMKVDSSTYPDYGSGNYEKYEPRISNDMDRMEFLHTVQQYLSEFRIKGHLDFYDTALGSIGFSMMRYGDCLYVTEANKDTGLLPGDRITHVDSKAIVEIAEREKSMLMGESAEREGMLWPGILKFYKNVTVVRQDGSTEVVGIILDSKADGREVPFSFKELDKGTLYLKISNFADEQSINTLYEDCRKGLDECQHLIIDVRGNGGGADTAFIPLLEYCFPEGEPAEKYIHDAYPVSVNYTKRNCKDRLSLIKRFLGDSVPEDVASLVAKMISDLNRNMGKGFVDESESILSGIIGRKNPERVWVLTDERCASSGEAFVEAVSFSPKVTVVGRPTCGITDYSNCNMVEFDDFRFVYPTSRDKRLDYGKGIGQKGFPVDRYIAWKPEHIGTDEVLTYVLEQIRGFQDPFLSESFIFL